jgi:hypothetical protein
MALIKVKTDGVDNTVNLGRRNIIINGAMQVAQRGTSDSANSNGFGVDRFKGAVTAMDNLVTSYTQESPTDLPGFTNSLRVTTTTAESALESNELLRMMQFIEGQNCQGFKYGTSSAEDVTLSFWVKSSITGTYAVSVYCDASTARMIGSTYTINSANTWEYKTITLVGDTTTVIDNDNSEGFRINWVLSAGSNYTSTDNTSWANYSGGQLAYGHTANGLVTTTNATWEITGVQLEVGDTATPFEHRSYGEELQLCKRYYERFGQGWWARFESGSQLVVNGQFKVEKRTAPTIGLPVGGTIRLYEWGVSDRDASPSLTNTAMAANGGHFKLSGFSAGGSTGEIWGIGGTPSDFSTHPFEAISEL